MNYQLVLDSTTSPETIGSLRNDDDDDGNGNGTATKPWA